MTMRKGLPAKLALTDADDTRYDFLNDVICNADGTPRGGVTSPVATNLITGSATMNVAVAKFAAMAVRDGGVIKLANDGSVNVLITAAPVSNSRIDLICARQNDASSTVSVPDANNTPLLYAVAGAAAPVPAAPALPAGSVEIGRVLVTAGNTNTNAMTITQASQYTASPGGIVPFRTLAHLQAWTTPRLGQFATVVADSFSPSNALYRWTGSAWSLMATPNRVQVVPTSYAVGSGSASIAADGKVTFTGVSSISVIGGFPNAKNYEIELVVLSATAGVYVRMRMRVSGADLASGSYAEFLEIRSTAVPADSYSIAATSMVVAYSDNTSLSKSGCTIKVTEPNVVGWTPTRAESASQERSTVMKGGARSTAAYPDFTLYPDSGTMTGYLTITEIL